MAVLIHEKDGVSGVKLRIDQPVFRIGRGDDNELSLDDELVSKYHAVIEAVASPSDEERFDYYLQDKNSTNHTYVNGDRISLFRLSHDDLIVIGMNNFRFVDDAHDDLEETTRIQKTWIPGVYFAKKKKKRKSRAKKKARGKK
jgi:pSer/pThr/pTyr-binding forkhead associated (FHA) protein